MSEKKPLKQVPINAIQPGMFMVKLDIQWMDSPFMSHNRKIRSEKEIALLKKSGAKVVTIDPNKGLDYQNALEKGAEPPSEPSAEPKTGDKNDSPKDGAPSSLSQEMSAALNVRNKVKRVINDLQKQLGAGQTITSESVAPILEQTLESLERNNQALLNLAHLSHRSQKLADHCFSTYCIALNLAQKRGLDALEIEALGLAALVHDCGWAKLPMQLLGKRKTYTPAEQSLIHTHADIGVKTLRSSELPELVYRLVLEHHERQDGSGFPNKLTSDKIHPLSKLLAVVVHYDESVHQLTDKPGMLPTNALRQLFIQAEKGVFDQKIVAELISLLGVYPISTAVKLSNGAKGIVREVHPDNHFFPVVEVHYDASGRELSPSKTVDLSKQSDNKDLVNIDCVIDPQSARDDPARRLTLDV